MMRHSDAKLGSDKNVSNAAKTLLANIRFLSVDKPLQAIMFSSAIPNEGKTFVARNTAIAMATSGKRTLIVDADMRRRSLGRELGVHAKNGIYSVLAGETPLEEAAIATKTRQLFFLDSEPNIPNPSDLIGSVRFSKLLQIMRKQYDFIVFDTPPLCTFVDAAVLGSMVDAAFIIVREHFAKRDEISNAANQLRQANAPLMGVIMNYCKLESSDYYYDYYYNDEKRKK